MKKKIESDEERTMNPSTVQRLHSTTRNVLTQHAEAYGVPDADHDGHAYPAGDHQNKEEPELVVARHVHVLHLRHHELRHHRVVTRRRALCV